MHQAQGPDPGGEPRRVVVDQARGGKQDRAVLVRQQYRLRLDAQAIHAAKLRQDFHEALQRKARGKRLTITDGGD